MECLLVYLNATNLHLHILHLDLYVAYDERVMQSLRNVRNAANTAVLVSSGVLAHHLVDGCLISLRPLLLESLFFTLLVYPTTKLRLEGSRLAILVIIAQGFSHVVLGGCSQSGLSMALSHGAAGLVTYLYILNSEHFWNFTLSRPTNMLVGFQVFYPSTNTRSYFGNFRAPERFRSLLTEMRLYWRGPPVLI